MTRIEPGQSGYTPPLTNSRLNTLAARIDSVEALDLDLFWITHTQFEQGGVVVEVEVGFDHRCFGGLAEVVHKALSREPDDEEVRSAVAFLADHELADFCQVLMGLNEFVFVE